MRWWKAAEWRIVIHSRRRKKAPFDHIYYVVLPKMYFLYFRNYRNSDINDNAHWILNLWIFEIIISLFVNKNTYFRHGLNWFEINTYLHTNSAVSQFKNVLLYLKILKEKLNLLRESGEYEWIENDPIEMDWN